ncbi:MAG TPA: ATP-binding protein, partial [Rhodanobacteraceae bacterium]|nr:ATP-binding protein [Rhodanobacteraceae bacterium]
MNFQSRFRHLGSLRLKLLLIALATLLLPLAGCLYLRQMDAVLRQAQERTLVASAQVLARSFVATANLPPPPTWHVQHTANPIVIDGYADDWAGLSPWTQRFAVNGRLLLAADGGWLYALAEVADTTRNRDDARLALSDHLSLAFRAGTGVCRYELAAAAPGGITASAQANAPASCPAPLAAQWQEDGSGYRVEWRMPVTPLVTQLGIAAFDAAAPAVAVLDLHPVLRDAPSVSRQLAEWVPPGTRARLLDASGWVIADGGAIAPLHGGDSGWFTTFLYRAFIAGDLRGAATLDRDTPRLDAGEVWQALSGVPATSWRTAMTRAGVTLAAAVPLPATLGEPRGVLLLEQGSRAMPLLADRGLLSMLLLSFGLLILAGGALVLFAIRLGLRIGSLHAAVDRAVQRGARWVADEPLPGQDEKDEIGDLARAFAALLEASRQHADYLRTLASKLSHELHTPLAIVKSSLENMEADELSGSARGYAARAHAGVERLAQLVRAMGAASRVERAIAATEPEDFNLKQLVAGCADGYRFLAGERAFELTVPEGDLSLHGAPDLLAQALDKLFENALSFTPDAGWIRLSLKATATGAEIELANQGPALPAELEEHLFDSLVSRRDGVAPGGAPHLGLGLYIVRLVAEQHGGRASARNIDGGVAF